MTPGVITYPIGNLLQERATVSYALNNHLYDIELYITNGGSEYIIAPTAIVELSFEDSLANWFVQGSLTVFYSNDLAEYLDKFVFRNDTEDLLRLRLIPRDLSIKGLPALNTQNKKLWEINEIFSIYNVEDVTPQDKSNTPAQTLKKFKKFSFWDIRYQILQNKVIEYSTADSNSDKKVVVGDGPFAEYSDESRSIPTGIAMDEIIKLAFEGDSILSKTGKDTQSGWEDGQTKIFFTSPASETAYDALMSVYDRHVSNESVGTFAYDYSLLTLERENGGIGYFSLEPISKYFDKAGSGESGPGEYQIEHFFLAADVKDITGQNKQVGYMRAPLNLTLGDRDLTFRDYSTITKYEFVDIAAGTNAGAFVNRPVYSFDFKNRIFNVEFSNHNLEAAENVFKQYVDKLYKDGTFGGGVNNLLIKNTNAPKLSRHSVAPVFSVYGKNEEPETRLADGLHGLLYTGLFQNTCINFTVPGITIRQPGRFIGIDRPQGSVDNSFDDKLCGQWFTVNVTHTICNGAYMNNITAIKLHSHKPAQFFKGLDTIGTTQPTPVPQIGTTAGLPQVMQGAAPGTIASGIAPGVLNSQGQPPPNFNPPLNQLPAF